MAAQAAAGAGPGRASDSGDRQGAVAGALRELPVPVGGRSGLGLLHRPAGGPGGHKRLDAAPRRHADAREAAALAVGPARRGSRRGDRRDAPQDPLRRGLSSEVVRHPGEGALHGPGDLRRGGDGQDHLVHAPVHPPASPLAEGQSGKALRDAAAGGQGRLLLPGPGDARGVRPDGRLHGDHAGRGRLAVEPHARSRGSTATRSPTRWPR